MAIEGLMERPTALKPEQYLAGSPDVAEAVGATIAAYAELGFAGDQEKAEETLTDDFQKLTELGYDGRLYVRPPRTIGLDRLIAAADAKRPDGVDSVWRYDSLWTPGTEENSYAVNDLETGPVKEIARLAIFNGDETTEVDPLLHHLDLPYDDICKGSAETTQMDELITDIAAFGEQDPGHNLDTFDHRDFVINALMDRIRGVEPSEQVLAQGFMRIPKLARRAVGGVSCVGLVSSDGGQLRFDRRSGRASSSAGVGLSAGLNEA